MVTEGCCLVLKSGIFRIVSISGDIIHFIALFFIVFNWIFPLKFNSNSHPFHGIPKPATQTTRRVLAVWTSMTVDTKMAASQGMTTISVQKTHVHLDDNDAKIHQSSLYMHRDREGGMSVIHTHLLLTKLNSSFKERRTEDKTTIALR